MQTFGGYFKHESYSSMTQIWRRRIFVGLMVVHAIAFAAFWVQAGLVQVAHGEFSFYAQLSPTDEMELGAEHFPPIVSTLCILWFWIPLFLLHTVLFVRKRNAIKRKNEFLAEIGEQRFDG